jgi:hypothetical protein
MSDFEQDARIGQALLTTGQEAASYVRPAGPQAVYGTVRRRRRNRMIVAGVAAAALVVGPIGGLAIAHERRNAPPAAPATNAAATRISSDELANATVEMPGWAPGSGAGCAAGPVTFSHGKANLDPPLEIIGQPAYMDVDHDGADETAFVVRCSPPGDDDKLVVVRRGSAGTIRTVGEVLGSAGMSGMAKVHLMRMWAVEAAEKGQLRLEVSEYRPCCDAAKDLPRQWRTYGWDGAGLSRTDGSGEFGPSPDVTDLQLTAGDVALAKQRDGSWTGSFTVTVHNAGPYDARTEIWLTGSIRLKGIAPAWASCRATPNNEPELAARCDLGTLRPGQAQTLTLPFTTTTAQTSTVAVAANHRSEEQGTYVDLTPVDNGAEVTITAK